MTPPLSLRVLIVDDDEDQLIVRSLLLECAGFTVMRAPDGPSAIALATTGKPHCAIVDLRLPTEEAGLQLIRELKSLNENIRLFILTGANPDRFLAQPEAGLVDEVLLKPASSARLIGRLKQLESQLHD